MADTFTVLPWLNCSTLHMHVLALPQTHPFLYIIHAQLLIEKHLQEEAKRQQQENEAAAMAVAKRQRMLESEKENIERKPFIELKTETRRFRQDVFKRRHRARALRNHGPSV
jgi:hypothetical protein